MSEQQKYYSFVTGEEITEAQVQTCMENLQKYQDDCKQRLREWIQKALEAGYTPEEAREMYRQSLRGVKSFPLPLAKQ